MVKNTTGGKGSKGLARKKETAFTCKLRLPEDDEYEIFAIVTKSLGNCMFHVNCINGLEKLLLRVRGKFSGRNKRNNFISVGTYVLVGLRDFEKPKYENCDLLEIYSDQEVKRLIDIPSIRNSRFFIQTAETLNNGGEKTEGKISEDDIVFSDTIIIEEKNEDKNSIKMIKIEEEEINFDDI